MTAYRKEIEAAAFAHGALDPNLIEAQVLVESSGRTMAYRYEPDFWTRYMAGKPEWTLMLPERVSASYGLLQIMYPVARELGFTGEPEMLCVPSVGLAWGCEQMRRLLEWAKGNTLQALAAYNGGKGGNATPPFRNAPYAAKVLEARSRLITERQSKGLV
jgi:soluble lytic murein transglycosylase-like protein